MMPIARAFFVFASAVIALWANHDFLDGSYAGPAWLMPIDFILTQLLVAIIVHLMWQGVKFQEGQPLISITIVRKGGA